MKLPVVAGAWLCALLVCQISSARPADRIAIERSAQGGMRFGPPELTVWAGGQIHWCNETGEDHQPGVVNDDGTFVAFYAGVLKPGCVSSVFSPMPRINVKSEKKEQTAFTIHYVCGLHRSEKGTIHVIPTP
jgi:plastocyanin